MTPLRRRGTALAAAVLAVSFALTACGSVSDDSGNASGETRQFEADNGTVEIPADPQRIVALGSAGVYLSLGVEPVGLGPKARDGELAWLPPEAARTDEAAVDVGEIDYEKVASLDPDLVVIYEPAHVWEEGSYDEERLRSVAPTIYIELNTETWKIQVERLADAVGELDNFEADKADYDAIAAEIKDEHADLLGSTTFMVLNRWSADFTPEAGTLAVESPGGYCVNHLEDAGLKILPEKEGEIDPELSVEQLSDTVADADVIIYPLGADGNVKPEFEPVLATNIWESLSHVKEGRAVGVKCQTIMTYSTKVVYLESLQEALGTLAEQE